MHVLPRALLLLVLIAADARAQVPAGPTVTGAGGASSAGQRAGSGSAILPPHAIPGDSTACHTGPIRYVFVDNHSIFDPGDPSLPARFDWAYTAANRLHVRTRKNVIRRQLLFHVGDCYDPELLAESARLLRGFDFISSADVYGVRQPDSSYHVVVDTQDQWSAGLGLRVRMAHGLHFDGFRLRDRNVLGTGQRAEVWYIEHQLARDYGALWQDPQLGGSRWDLTTAVARNRAGSDLRQVLQHPFLGETGRWAAREDFRLEDDLVDIVVGNAPQQRDLLVPMREEAADVALVGRLGQPGHLTLFGGGLRWANRTFPGAIDMVTDLDYATRAPADSTLANQVATQMQPRDHVRAVLLLGQRNIWWIQRRGYDSMRGQEDIRLGGELAVTLSHSLPTLARDNDFGTTVTLYTGFLAGPALVVLRARGDGLREYSAAVRRSQWQDIYGDGELLGYLKPSPLSTQTFVLRVAGAGGWRSTAPFQLTLGGNDAVRGYDWHDFPGGRRIVVTGEDRIYFGWPFPQLFDLGGTVFADVGRIWPGDAPFGVDSGWRTSLGLGLRASFPAGSRLTYRADVALPMTGGLRRARFLLSAGETIGLVRRPGPTQLDRSRPEGISSDLFSFPH